MRHIVVLVNKLATYPIMIIVLHLYQLVTFKLLGGRKFKVHAVSPDRK